jgi:P27 family predicted phage terminase small subunit
MGKVGRPKKPSALKVLEGNPGKRPMNEKEPKPQKANGKYKPTFKLSPRAKRIFNRLCPVLDRVGLLTEIDFDPITQYCDIYDKWLKCKEHIEKNGLSYPLYGDPIVVDGEEVRPIRYYVKYTEATQYKEFWNMMLKIQSSFGLSPSDRASLEVELAKGAGEEPEDRTAAFLFGGKKKGMK